MAKSKKTTAEVPDTPQETKTGVAETVGAELQKIPRSEAYRRLLALRGKVHLTYDIDELRQDRD